MQQVREPPTPRRSHDRLMKGQHHHQDEIIRCAGAAADDEDESALIDKFGALRQ